MRENNIREHHDVIETSTKDTSDDLGCICDFWREFVLLSEFQISKKVLALLKCIESKSCKVHVC